MHTAQVDVTRELRCIAADFEAGLLGAVRDVAAPASAEMSLMQTWSRLVLLVERVEGGDPTSRQAPFLPPAPSAAPSHQAAVPTRRVSSVQARSSERDVSAGWVASPADNGDISDLLGGRVVPSPDPAPMRLGSRGPTRLDPREEDS